MTRARALLMLVILFVVTACAPSAPRALAPPPTSSADSAVEAPSSGLTSPLPTSEDDDVAPAPATGPAPAATVCATGWGSQPRTNMAMGTAAITGIRTARHACFDRIVIDIGGTATGFTAKFVDTVTADGSGNPVTVPGGARIQLVVRHPAATPAAVGTSVANVGGFTTLRSVVAAGSFEGISTYGVGVRARVPFRVFVLQNPGRIILDIAHRW